MLRAVLALAALLLAVPADADDASPAPAAPAAGGQTTPELDPDPWLPIDSYMADGPFVSWPARAVGMTTLIVIGGGAAAFCTPIDMVRGLALRRGYGEVAEACGSRIGDAAATGAYLAAGAPFWAVKKTFWDGPRKLLG